MVSDSAKVINAEFPSDILSKSASNNIKVQIITVNKVSEIKSLEAIPKLPVLSNKRSDTPKKHKRLPPPSSTCTDGNPGMNNESKRKV